MNDTRQRIKKELIMCNGFEMTELKEEKWLGDYLARNSKSL